MQILSISATLVFFFLSVVHIYWGFGGEIWSQKAIPEINGKPAFIPSKFITIIVALALAVCSLVVLFLGFSSQINRSFFQYIIYLSWFLAGVFFLRAIGDFNLVGFFKKIKDSEFAKYDSLLYSPLCLVLSLIFAILAYNQT